jgi:hypothetical protein
MIAKPVRLRLSRSKGFNLQRHSLATNGLPAVNVARPSKWGNPFKFDDSSVHPVLRYACEVAPLIDPSQIAQLRGKNLACYCYLEKECHANVLLDMANEEEQR